MNKFLNKNIETITLNILIIYQIKKLEDEKNYIAEEIFKFIKNFLNLNKANFYLDNLVQYLDNDINNFTNLMISILETVGDFNNYIYEDIKNIFADGLFGLKVEGNQSCLEIKVNEEKIKRQKNNELSG